MSVVASESAQSFDNPLDAVEELASANEWPFDRAGEDELVAEVVGRWCTYRLYFFWQPDVGAMQFSCSFDLKVQKGRKVPVSELLAEINNRLWLGHFDICREEQTPMFRQTILLRSAGLMASGQLEDLIEIAVTECDRFYPAFQYVLWGGRTPAEAVQAAVLETVGEA